MATLPADCDDLAMRLGLPVSVVSALSIIGWALIGVNVARSQPDLGSWSLVYFFTLITTGSWLAILLHELGHLLAGRLFGGRVKDLHIGSPPTGLHIPMGQAMLHLGVGFRGRVVWREPPRAQAKVLVYAAGPVANLAMVPILIVLPVPRAIAVGSALISGFIGLLNLLPFRHARSGLPSDGAHIFLPSVRRLSGLTLAERLQEEPDRAELDDAIERLLAGYRRGSFGVTTELAILAMLLRKAERIDELLDIHADMFEVEDPALPTEVNAVHTLVWYVLTVPRLPGQVIELATRRAEWVIEQGDAQLPRGAVLHTLALARLREGKAVEVEGLCAEGLATHPEPQHRATILATIALARHALRQDARTPLLAALELDAKAELVDEAVTSISVLEHPS